MESKDKPISGSPGKLNMFMMRWHQILWASNTLEEKLIRTCQNSEGWCCLLKKQNVQLWFWMIKYIRVDW